MGTIFHEPDASEPAERDARITPTPDRGTLGIGSESHTEGPGPQAGSQQAFGQKQLEAGQPGLSVPQIRALAAAGAAVWIFGLIAMLIAWRSQGPALADLHLKPGTPESAYDARALDRLQPQRQAETLLEMAVGHSAGAVEQISSRVDRWPGKVQWNTQIASLTTAALNSDDMHVRESGVEVELAAYGLGKNQQSLDYVMQTAASRDHARKTWALWALGLMANRGVQPEYAVNTLAVHLHDRDEDSRMWAVDGLALAGTERALRTLLTTMHDDPSPKVREAAACGLGQSGMSAPDLKMTAVPVLINYADDPSLDAATRAWAFHALADITHQHLGNDAAAWRRWYGGLGR
jgi:hypothetical protein